MKHSWPFKHVSLSDFRLPDRTFHNFRVLKSVDRRFWISKNLTIGGFWSPSILKSSVLFLLFIFYLLSSFEKSCQIIWLKPTFLFIVRLHRSRVLASFFLYWYPGTRPALSIFFSFKIHRTTFLNYIKLVDPLIMSPCNCERARRVMKHMNTMSQIRLYLLMHILLHMKVIVLIMSWRLSALTMGKITWLTRPYFLQQPSWYLSCNMYTIYASYFYNCKHIHFLTNWGDIFERESSNLALRLQLGKSLHQPDQTFHDNGRQYLLLLKLWNIWSGTFNCITYKAVFFS